MVKDSMNPEHKVSYEPVSGLFAVATIARDPTDINARALGHHGLLRFHALGTRKGAIDVPPELTRLNPKIMGLSYIGSLTLPRFYEESFRFRLHPWFDRWAGKLVVPGDHIISSFGFTNNTFRKVRSTGGKTFYSAGNSHPRFLWELVEEEHRRWNCSYPPYARFQHKRVLEMMPLVDYVLSPSTFVTKSFVAEGFRPEQILRNFYPVDLSHFVPRKEPRPKDRPLSVITTGALTLRKGTPYLFEAFRIVLKKIPNARLLLTDDVMSSMTPVMAKYSDLPIDWAPAMPHAQLAERLRNADIFSMPSIEDGFGRTVTEALACGLPVIITPNTGAADFVKPGVNGEIVPIRDAQAIADAILKWADRILTNPDIPPVSIDASQLSFEAFEREFLEDLADRGLIKRKGEKLQSKSIEA
jgi:glycosyltransferase involved in cell wall biosynthesis